MFAWLLSLLGLRSRRTDDGPIGEEAAYAHSYGERTGDIVSVEPMPEPEPEPIPLGNGDLTGEFLRRAFEQKLEARKKLTT
jgi:hypothetical protein